MIDSAYILLVDDHPALLAGLRNVLSENCGTTVLEGFDTRSMFQQLANHHVDLLILDLGLPGNSGLAALKEVRKRYPSIPVLIFTMYPETQFAVRVFRAGASGFLNKQAPESELKRAIETILNGKKYISDAAAQELAGSYHPDQITHNTLTDREFEIFLMLARGDSISKTAERLSLSVKTISTHRSNILNKMQLRSTYELIRYAIQHNLVNSSDSLSG